MYLPPAIEAKIAAHGVETAKAVIAQCAGRYSRERDMAALLGQPQTSATTAEIVGQLERRVDENAALGAANDRRYDPLLQARLLGALRVERARLAEESA